jgi:aspartate ammonia-lyase
VIAYRLLSNIQTMTRAYAVLRDRCVVGITANPERMRWFLEHSIGVITALVPAVGYETATEIAKEAQETGGNVYDIVCERGLVTREELDRLLNPEALTGANKAR